MDNDATAALADRDGAQAEISLDDLDRKILQELQDDGRRAFRDIARTLQVSEATVRGRVKRLRDTGVLQILGYVDPAAYGYGTMVVLLVKASPAAHSRAVAEFTAWPETTWVSTTIGRSNIYVQMLCKDSDSLYALLTSRLGDVDGIVDVDVIQEVKVHKAEYHYSRLS
ncbi:Lrp/AsnC family transcriptional regulator [Nocardioides ferulae]|uniref:Lrp/AsnC family transcriptional regulator n=1 Tax=Nocardioides ferulae TaxID=2340821 RepID=UPI0013DD9CBD|nr:Lrp/AsnC family transcriptional regulator [Nocardioides ferulae]